MNQPRGLNLAQLSTPMVLIGGLLVTLARASEMYRSGGVSWRLAVAIAIGIVLTFAATWACDFVMNRRLQGLDSSARSFLLYLGLAIAMMTLMPAAVAVALFSFV